MKRYGHLFEEICSIDNLRLAHKNAQKGKGWYSEVKMVNSNPDKYLFRLQETLINKTYRTSDYETFLKTDGKKPRKIYKLPYYPDRVCQWAVMQVIEPMLVNTFTADTYSAIPGRGIHQALNKTRKAIQNDVAECQYCLKFDIKKYYPSINHDILKQKFRRLFKDNDLLWLIDEIIDSIATAKIEDMQDIWLLSEDVDDETGIPIGNYLSQWMGNYFLSSFDHWIKEIKHRKYYFRYMDDITIYGSSSFELHSLKIEIASKLKNELCLKIKENWQIFPTYIRGVDYVGYRVFLNFTLLRKTTYKQMKSRMLYIIKKLNSGKEMNYSEWCSINSYKGWLNHCDSYRLFEKYIKPLENAANRFYLERVKSK